MSEDEIRLLREEWKYVVSKDPTFQLTETERDHIDEWNGATLREKFIGFGLYFYCYSIAGEGTEAELVHSFAYANQNIGHLVHFWEPEGRVERDIQKEVRSNLARSSANSLHDAPGGSRDKRRAIKEIWLTGKYDSKDLCAEQECGGIAMSFATARKALRGLPAAASLREQRLAPASTGGS